MIKDDDDGNLFKDISFEIQYEAFGKLSLQDHHNLNRASKYIDEKLNLSIYLQLEKNA